MEKVILIKNEQERIKFINQFCCLTALLSTPYLYILSTNKLIFSTGIMFLIILLFLACVYLNKKNKPNFSKALVIFTTNFAVTYFSLLLGFDSGVHLFLFSAPLITYLLFDFTKKTNIVITMTVYALNFSAIYIINKLNLVEHAQLQNNIHQLLYFMNFSFSITLCFFLIIYFANNNSLYINLLREANITLETQQIQMQNKIIENTETNKKLSETLKEKETLLSEIHHRVKNNLAVISGLIELQNIHVTDELASRILKESHNRIKSIALLHEKFYESKHIDSIEIRSYVNELIHLIKLSFTNNNIKIHTQIDNIELSMTEALPFSLLLNELITNSYKHAFKQKKEGNIYITFTKTNNEYVLNYKDDGFGFDAKASFKEKSLGMNLIEAFSKQLKAKAIWTSEIEKGVDFNLNFKHK